MAKAIGIIKQEHLNYLALLTCLEHMVLDIERGRAEPDFEVFDAVIDYIESFLDRFHHPKEDEFIFETLRERWPKCEPLIRTLEREHIEGAQMLAGLKAALADYRERGAAAFPAFAERAKEYQEHQYEHMRLEEMEALPLAREHLSEDDWQTIDTAFTSHDDPLFGAERRREFRKLFSRIVELAPPPYGFGKDGRLAPPPESGKP